MFRCTSPFQFHEGSHSAKPAYRVTGTNQPTISKLHTLLCMYGFALLFTATPIYLRLHDFFQPFNMDNLKQNAADKNAAFISKNDFRPILKREKRDKNNRMVFCVHIIFVWELIKIARSLWTSEPWKNLRNLVHTCIDEKDRQIFLSSLERHSTDRLEGTHGEKIGHHCAETRR